MGSDQYETFSALKSSEPSDAFSIVVRDRVSPVLVMAIHGGAIETGTSEIATVLAGSDFSLYLFEGRKHSGNAALHITSHRFDEPQALEIAARSEIVLSVHGCAGPEQMTYMGGADAELGATIHRALILADFPVNQHDRPSLQGLDLANICNRGRRKHGVQLELSRGLRDVLAANAASLALYTSTMRGVLKVSSKNA